MSPKYRYKFRCFCNALFSCSRLILLIQTNVLKLYREILTECLATSALCSLSNEECHLVLRPDKRFSCLRRIRRQRNQLYPFLQILEACFDVWQRSSSTRFNALHKCKFNLYSCMYGCINKAVSKHDQAKTGVGRGGRGRVNTVYISIGT